MTYLLYSAVVFYVVIIADSLHWILVTVHRYFVCSHILLWATFCAALVPGLLPSVSGGHVSALEITFQNLFSVDLFYILLKITHFKFIGPNHCG